MIEGRPEGTATEATSIDKQVQGLIDSAKEAFNSDK